MKLHSLIEKFFPKLHAGFFGEKLGLAGKGSERANSYQPLYSSNSLCEVNRKSRMEENQRFSAHRKSKGFSNVFGTSSSNSEVSRKCWKK